MLTWWLTRLVFSRVLQAQAKLGGQGVQPYYTLIEGGEDGELEKELEDYFYYSQLRR